MKLLPLPPFYDSDHATRWSYAPDAQALFEAASLWRAEHAVAPAEEDRRLLRLLLVDVQRDFCFPEGSLYVGGRSGRGALEDNDRLARFIYRNLALLGEITCTLDTHYPLQIFFPAFWLDEDGRPPAPHRQVSADDVRRGRLRPDPALAAWLSGGDLDWLRRQAEFYCAELERAGKYALYLWPPHCLLGGPGHTLAGVVQEARLFHAWCRRAPAPIEIKGGHPLSENYSVLAPELLLAHDGGRLAERNEALVKRLLASDALVVAGQAASHCVRSSLDDLLESIQARDPRLAERVYVLRDCMSAVAVPDPVRPGAFLADFTPQAEAAFARWQAAGMHLVESTTPLSEWPAMRI